MIHLAFEHDLSFTGEFADTAAAEQRAIAALGDALAGTQKPFVITSGMCCSRGRRRPRGTEEDRSRGRPAARSENAVIAMAAARGARLDRAARTGARHADRRGSSRS